MDCTDISSPGVLLFFCIAVKFEALATATSVHHMLVYGCSEAHDADMYRYNHQCYHLLSIFIISCIFFVVQFAV